MLNCKAEIRINSEGDSAEGDQKDLQGEDSNNDDDENMIVENSGENVELNYENCTYSWSFLQFMKLNTCIMTNALKMKVKCRE